MKNSSTIRVVKPCMLVLLHLVTLTTGYGQFNILKKAVQVAGDVGKLGVNIATAPVKTVVNTAQVVHGKKSVSEIYKPYQDIAKSAGTAGGNAATLITEPHRYVYGKAQEFTSKNFGRTGEFIFDIATFQNRFLGELSNSTAQSAANILKGENPLQVISVPLAAAIRAAREKHIVDAQPLPAEIITALTPHFKSSTLNRARFTRGIVDITLPNFIGRSHRFQGDHYAVVVDDVIVFNVSPPSYANNPSWWIHEITHVEQYENLGIEKFSYKYLKDLGNDIEGEANSKAAQLTNISIAQSNVYKTESDAQSSEKFVAQCVFPEDELSVTYLISNQGRIYAIDPLSGQYVHIGYAQPPLLEGVAWTYKTANLTYAVTPEGQILSIINKQWVQIGRVHSLI